MKILHVPFSYWPDPPGGTEIYVKHLSEALHDRGVDSAVAVPGTEDRADVQHGILVHRFAAETAGASMASLYGAGDPATAAAFGRVLDRLRPDVMHQHALSPACSPALMAEAKSRDIPVVFTYHTPTVSCQRGTLLKWGREICDGVLATAPCTVCVLEGLGLARPLGQVLANAPHGIARALGRTTIRGRLSTALRMPALVDQRHQSIRAAFDLPDRIVALASWVRTLLIDNGVAPNRIVTVRHGLPHAQRESVSAPIAERRLRVACIGRFHPTKGMHIAIAAVRAIPDAALDLDIVGVAQDDAARRYKGELVASASGDRRIRFVDPWPHEDVISRLSAYDLLLVPSQWLETGPLVVLEAFAAGVPVVASALGGPLDLVDAGVNGLLVRPFDSIHAWAAALDRCVRDKTTVAGLRTGVRPPRSMKRVAGEMAAVYAAVALGPGHPQSHPATVEAS